LRIEYGKEGLKKTKNQKEKELRPLVGRREKKFLASTLSRSLQPTNSKGETFMSSHLKGRRTRKN